MSEEEFALWMQYDRECALPDYRLEVTSGLHMQHLVNMQLKMGDRLPLSTFMLFQPQPEAAPEPDRMEMFRNAKP